LLPSGFSFFGAVSVFAVQALVFLLSETMYASVGRRQRSESESLFSALRPRQNFSLHDVARQSTGAASGQVILIYQKLISSEVES
jgi:hypothetical protein